MARFRYLLILGVNVLVLGWVLKVFFFDQGSEMVGLFGLATLMFLLFYDVYTIFLYKLFPITEQLAIWLEGAFTIALALPFVLLYVFTN